MRLVMAGQAAVRRRGILKFHFRHTFSILFQAFWEVYSSSSGILGCAMIFDLVRPAE
jgi:hypothetical protein